MAPGMSRLEELRTAAEERLRALPAYDGSPEEIAKRAAEAPFWEALQAEAIAWLDDPSGVS